MADVDAQAARGDILAPMKSFGVGIRREATPGHRLLAGDSGLIDAFAEVFARMSTARPPESRSKDRGEDETSGDQSPESEPVGNSQSQHASSDARRDLHAVAQEPFDDAAFEADPIQEAAQSDATDLLSDEKDSRGTDVTDVVAVCQTEENADEVAHAEQNEADQVQAVLTQANGQNLLVDDSPASQNVAAEETHATEQVGLPDESQVPSDESREHDGVLSDSGSIEQQASERQLGEGDPSGVELADDANANRDVSKHSRRRSRDAHQTPLDVEPVSASSRTGARSTPSFNAGPDAMTSKSLASSDSRLPDAKVPTSHQTNDRPLATTSQIQGVAAAISRSNHASPSTSALTGKGLPLNAEFGRVSANPQHRDASKPGVERNASETMARIKLIQRVSKAFHHLGKEGGSIRLRLAPAELGTVRVEMQVHHRQVSARVVAETEIASAALREHLPELRARLESYGMQVERLDVETEASEHAFRAGQEGQSRWQSPGQQQQSDRSFTTASSRTPTSVSESDLVAPVASASLRSLPGSGVDVRL